MYTIEDYIIDYKKNGNKYKGSWLINNHPLLYKKLLNYVNNDNLSINEMIYCYVNELNDRPICKRKNCNNEVNYSGRLNRGYSKYCSKKCGVNSEEVIKKRKKTNLEKYGVEYSQQSKEVKTKIVKTNLERYGVDNAFKSIEIRKIYEKNLIDKYGVKNPFQDKYVKEKIKKTNLEKYGVEYSQQSKEVKTKIVKTNLERYGFFVASKNSDVKQKSVKTNQEKYGVEYPQQNKIIREKTEKTNLKRYGFKSYLESNEAKYKIEKNILNIKDNYINKIIKLFNLNIYDVEYFDSENIIVKNYCNKHKEGFLIKPKHLYSRKIMGHIVNLCTICNPISELSSVKEKELCVFITGISKNYDINNRKILNGKEIDIYLPEYKLGFEFNGLYYHSNVFKDNNYHYNKTNNALKKNIELVHIFEDEWIYKNDIVKSLIKSKLNINQNKLHSKNTIVKEVSSKDSFDFLNENHIQGNLNSSVRLGLYYENELVSVMTFNNKRKGMNDNKYEICRFTNKINTSIIGGINKLFNYFLNKINPLEIIVNVDRRYFNGVIFENLGFKFIKISEPNYFYVKGLERIDRNILLKESLNFNKTENNIMLEKNYNKIYDSGNIKYEWTK